MTDRTCLDLAAEAIDSVRYSEGSYVEARAALDAIHPALVDLTPDDVDWMFRLRDWWLNGAEGHPPVLSRD